MHFKKKIQKKIYKLYLKGVDLTSIAMLLDMSVKDVDEIIDFIVHTHF